MQGTTTIAHKELQNSVGLSEMLGTEVKSNREKSSWQMLDWEKIIDRRKAALAGCVS